MEIERILIRGLLSFGEATEPIHLKKLNVFIGPNGSGKSNLLDILDLIRSLPRDLSACIRKGGGIHEWIWKGKSNEAGSIELFLASSKDERPLLRYFLSFAAAGGRVEILDEKLENARPFDGHPKPYLYYGFDNGRPIINLAGERRQLQRDQIDPRKSILEQRRDPDSYPEITRVADVFKHIRLYREWSVGRQNPLRQPQSTDGSIDFLEPDGSNLGLILNNLRKYHHSELAIQEGLNAISPDYQGFHIEIASNAVQIFVKEDKWLTPATRLSDGTLRYLALLAILCHPSPPPILCIEEPEIGLHPDLLPGLARLLEQASERCQLLVTTHSDILVDALTHRPDSIFIVEKHLESTSVRPLSSLELGNTENGLGELWTSGQIGGTRW